MNLEPPFFLNFSGLMPGLCENVNKIYKNHEELVNFSFMTSLVFLLSVSHVELPRKKSKKKS